MRLATLGRSQIGKDVRWGVISGIQAWLNEVGVVDFSLCIAGVNGVPPGPAMAAFVAKAVEQGVLAVRFFGEFAEQYHDAFDELAQPFYGAGAGVIATYFGSMATEKDARQAAFDALYASSPLEEYLDRWGTVIVVSVNESSWLTDELESALRREVGGVVGR